MQFIKTQNFKNMLNAFNDSVTASNPTVFSNAASADQGHNVIGMGSITADGNIYSVNSANETIWQFASDGNIRDATMFRLVGGSLEQINGYAKSYCTFGTLDYMKTALNRGVSSGIRDVINDTSYGTVQAECYTFILCEDSTITANTNSPTGRFKIMSQVGSTILNRGKTVYSLIDNENGEITANSIMILWQGGHSYNYAPPVILGGCVLDTPITTGYGVTATIEVDWGLNPLT